MTFTDLSTSEKIVIRANQESLYGMEAVKLKEFAKSKIQENPRPLHLDFSQTKYLDSVAVGGLFDLYATYRKLGCRVVIDGASESVRQLLKNLTMDRLLVM